MRAAVLALVAVAVPAAAEPWVEPDPAAVVGRWSGKASWRGCVITGAARTSVVLARDGGGYRVDLAPVLDGLGRELLAPVGGRELEATHDDLRVRWLAGKPGKATLRLGFASGCEATIALVRDTTGIAACDELVALRAIATTCLEAPPPVPPRPRRLVAAQCRREVAPLRTLLIEQGCVPAPLDPAQATAPVPECIALVATVDRLMRCDRVPVETKQRLRISMGEVDRWASVDRDDPEARQRAAATCEELREELTKTMSLLGCL